jgi:hypothetical protein
MKLEPSVRILSGFAAFLILSGSADAQTMTLEGAARAYSASYFMRTFCPKFFKVDGRLAEKANAAFLEAGIAKFGPNAMQAAIVPEIERRRAEILATGESQWCQYQRSFTIDNGFPQLFR